METEYSRGKSHDRFRLPGAERGIGGSTREAKACPSPPSHKSKITGQSLVEFALVLPIFMLLIVGIIEAGRMFLIYASITSASREASRYGASVGENEIGMFRYLDCEGMRAAARNVAVLSELDDTDIEIFFDRGDISLTIATCDSHPSEDAIELGDRVVVTVNTTYSPIVPIIPIPELPISSTTARTILKDITPQTTLEFPGPAPTSTPTVTETAMPSATPTETEVAGATITSTATSTETAVASETPEATRTSLPTATAIPVPLNFEATISNCSERNISFDWDPVPGASSYAIYKIDPPPAMQVAIDITPPCINCSILPDSETSRTYVVVAIVDGHESAPSSPSTVSCP